MANRGQKPPGNEGNQFERNKYRQTMPSRFNPLSPPDHRNGPPNRFNTNSPTQSFVSTTTNYEQPWSSPKFKAPSTPNEPRFRRTNSMAANTKKGGQKEQDDKKNDSRPKINFMEFGKKFTNKFKKSKNNETKKGDRMSAPVLKLGESSAASTTSQPQLPSTASSPGGVKTKSAITATASMKMQPEDRMKMFQKMGRQQTMKETSLQRMQRERQRDFSLVPGPGRACLEANKNTGSSQSIESMLIFNTTPDSRRSTSLSMTDDDVEPIFKNSLTNKQMTSSQFNKQQQQKKFTSNGPSFTSTPRLNGSNSFHVESPTISNVRSASEASFCIGPSEDSRRTESTMYFSADTLNNSNPYFAIPRGPPTNSGFSANSGSPGNQGFSGNPRFSGNQGVPSGNPGKSAPQRSMTDVSLASTASTPTEPTTSDSQIPAKRVKNEIVDDESNCPSFTSSTPTSDLEGGQMNQGSQSNQPAHLNNLWNVSKEILNMQQQLEKAIPRMDSLRNRAMAIDQQKILLIEEKGEDPTVDDMTRLWKLDREFLQLNQEMGMASMIIQEAHNMLPFLEMRRNELLSVSPTPQGSQPSLPNFQQGSLV
uniref:Uncharacterized protein n=1 Tax=Caenorhabditis tropicalis TaxID=1561998 RepID=A0A1I7UK58_9PELO